MAFAQVCGSVHTRLLPQTIALDQVTVLPHTIAELHAVSLTPIVLPHTMALPHTIAWFQVSDSPPMVVRGAGIVFSHQLPAGSDVSMARAMSMAPLVLIAPAPLRSGSYSTPASSWMPTDVYSRIDFTALGVNFG